MASKLREVRDRARKEKTRDALLGAAATVFVRKGYHPTLISDIVAEAGAGQGTFYRHFASKRALIDALFDRFTAAMLEGFSEMGTRLPATAGEYMAASEAAVARLAEVVMANRDLALVFLRQGPAVDESFERKMSDVTDRFAAVAKLHLDRAIAGGFARPCNSELVAQSLVGIALRQIERYLTGRMGEASAAEVAHEVVDFAFRGLLPSGALGSSST